MVRANCQLDIICSKAYRIYHRTWQRDLDICEYCVNLGLPRVLTNYKDGMAIASVRYSALFWIKLVLIRASLGRAS